jgi:hypothetical protein
VLYFILETLEYKQVGHIPFCFLFSLVFVIIVLGDSASSSTRDQSVSPDLAFRPHPM